MRHDYTSIITQIMRFKDITDKDGVIIRHLILDMIPTMAYYDREEFTAKFLPLAMKHMLSQLRAPQDCDAGNYSEANSN